MSVRLTEDEAWEMLAAAHTGIFTTLTSAGWPVSLPIWFVVHERAIYVRTPAGAKKVARIRRDDRGCFLVERGEQWTELAAVELPVRATVVEDGGLADRLSEQFDTKYRGFRTSRRELPSATKSHYSGMTHVRLVPAGELITWDNSRIRLAAGR
jgi:hypothetical protein